MIRTSLLILAICAGYSQVFAQTTGKNMSDPRPFAPGEVLRYEAKLSKVIQGIPVGDLTFTVTNIQPDGNYLIKAEAVSKGTLLSIARYSFLQQYQSTIGFNNFRALKTTKHDVQKERVRDSEAVFDYGDKRVTYVESDPKEPMKPPRKIASVIPDQAHDIISGIYALRLLPLAVDKTFDFTLSDSGLVYDIPVKVTARELQKTVLGKVWCFRVEPDVFGPGRLIEKEGRMIIWITDDARRIPVRSQINASVGKIEVKLRAVTSR